MTLQKSIIMIYTKEKLVKVKEELDKRYSLYIPKIMYDLVETALVYANDKEYILQLIQSHADKQDQDMCWENDIELYEKLEITYNKDKLPKNKEEHAKNCDKYREGLFQCTPLKS